MTRNSRRAAIAAIASVLFGLAAWTARPAARDASTPSWPRHAITIVVPFPPGGGTDLLARKLGDRLARRLGQPVVVENRAGASGSIGARAVADAPADGYTLLLTNSTLAINPSLYRRLPFSPRHDFVPVINLAFAPSVIVVAADAPWHTLADLSARDTRRAPIAYASCGDGTPQHLAGEALRLAGMPLLHVPYRGCGPALIDAISGQVPLAIVTVSSAMPFLQSGRLRALAITAAARSPLLPDVATVAEQGYPGYAQNQWQGLLAPAGMPADRVARLRETLAAILQDPSLGSELRQLGFDPASGQQLALGELLDTDLDRYDRLVRQLKLQMD